MVRSWKACLSGNGFVHLNRGVCMQLVQSSYAIDGVGSHFIFIINYLDRKDNIFLTNTQIIAFTKATATEGLRDFITEKTRRNYRWGLMLYWVKGPAGNGFVSANFFFDSGQKQIVCSSGCNVQYLYRCKQNTPDIRGLFWPKNPTANL